MIPANLPLSFELGADGAADFTLSEDLGVVRAAVVFRANRGATATATVDCAVDGLRIVLEVPRAVLAALGAGTHAYQLDVELWDGSVLRLVKGDVRVAFGAQVTFGA